MQHARLCMSRATCTHGTFWVAYLLQVLSPLPRFVNTGTTAWANGVGSPLLFVMKCNPQHAYLLHEVGEGGRKARKDDDYHYSTCKVVNFEHLLCTCLRLTWQKLDAAGRLECLTQQQTPPALLHHPLVQKHPVGPSAWHAACNFAAS